MGSGLWRAKSFFFLVARNCPSNASNPSSPSNPSNPSTPQTPRTWPMVLPYWSLQPPQTPRTLPMVLPDWPLETLQNLALARLWALGSVRWPLETLQNLALARLWALGSVRDCGRSCADCGVGALARQILGSAILAVGDARCSEPEFAQEMKENERKVFFLGIQRERLSPKVQPGEARFGPELDWEKPWRGQVFGARICTRNERK